MTKKPEPFLTLGFAAIDWVEHYLVHGPGDVQGQPIELDDEFAVFIAKAYQVDASGARVVRRAFLSRAKGRNKSGLAAMIACFEALGPCRFDHFAVEGEVSPWGYRYDPGEPVGKPLAYVEILNVATEEGQAGNTYDAIFYMLHPESCSPELLRDYGKVDVGVTRTVLPGRRGFIEPVTSADSSKDGGKSTFIVADETHLWLLPRLKRLHGIMTRNLLKRKIASGWMLETSTMYAAGEESVAQGTHDYAKSLENGRKRDRTLLFDHRQAADHWDLTQRDQRLKALHEAYGPAAEWMNLDAICDSWDDPQVSEAEFRRFWLNQPVSMLPVEPGAIDHAGWAETVKSSLRPEFVAAFGVAVSLDRSRAAIGAAYLADDGKPAIELVPAVRGSSQYIRRGSAWIVDRCVELAAESSAAVFVIDAGGPARWLIEPLRNAGLNVEVLQGRDVSAACDWLADAVKERSLWHGPQPELDDQVEAAKWRDIGDGLRAFGRRASVADICGLEAVTLATHVLPSLIPLDNVSVTFI